MKIKALRDLLAKASPLPWCEDDGNLFSKPISDARMDRIMARIESRTTRDGENDGELHDGFVAKCPQDLPNFVADAYFIEAAVNALPAFLELAKAAVKHRRDHGNAIGCSTCAAITKLEVA